ncbi:hypothetical protein SERLA73DRAFT_78326 [Serpula lacrymans var. lacrymans S7.3]|uniref:UvrD-like helicase ATP-binding domain-containing protein n=2 Tax=Serpula lacrymans var. lacrymans TaxID=341189 RepID=F8QCS9_SERL3|nr:uncharacterized protein SERLADRAFT_443362 [Serpula lacrymans var. lacrymans S7.9]EGN93944.1 hypothetical protein SERLA73DRAFT_78326 [Serpula lacrymans var. lacrymans S7.3]EGO19314.1 hypothetical protein SERLADRAFT_443362 [Serpula lacrymans var. lacrymans S7.9]
MPYNTDNVSPARWGLDMSIFDQQRLASGDALNQSVEIFESLLDGRSIAMSDDSYRFLRQWIVDCYPSNPKEFTGSIHAKILSQLSLSLLFLVYPADEPSNLVECRRSVQLVHPVLDAIPSLAFTGGPGASSEQTRERSAGKPQRNRRHLNKGKRGVDNLATDVTLFQAAKVDVPNSREEGYALASSLLKDQERILQYYLDILRRPLLCGVLYQSYIRPKLRNISRARPSIQTDITDSDDTSKPADEIDSAHPYVQPLKAALYFENATGFGEWQIWVSSRANGDLREARRQDRKSFAIIIKKIKELSNGHFSNDNQKRLGGAGAGVPIYEAKMTRDKRLVYHIDCRQRYDNDFEQQVIRIFGIYTHAQMDDRLWNSVSYHLAKQGKEYKLRCTLQKEPSHAPNNIVLPASFPPQETVGKATVSPMLAIPEEHWEELNSLLMGDKLYILSQELLNSIVADRDVAHVFAVSPKENEIIEHTSSSFVIGRSGTGKTTTMLFKMLGMERLWELHADTMAKPRQVFVTRSRVLAGKVNEYFTKLMESLALQGLSAKELAEMDHISSQREKELINIDEIDWRSDLPSSFSLLQDEHFPLFVTFDRLCALLEADAMTSQNGTNQYPDRETRFSRLKSDIDHSTITFDDFLQHCWRHLPQLLKKGLEPSLVFSEFIGVIKGSEESLSMPERYLDVDTYIKFSHRSQSTFALQRGPVYELFEHYQKWKQQQGVRDAADRCHTLLDFISKDGLPGQRIDYLYVDEVQDNLLIDALLLRALCKNPEGMFWAGDTAQAISVGSAFNFNSLKAMLYRAEEYYRQINEVLRAPIPPRTFQLAVNYRSHSGIVECAQSVVSLITQFFPDAIDVLPDEKGLVDGAKPIFFTGENENSVEFDHFFSTNSGTEIELGARQCILVRNDAAREQLPSEIKNMGLVMTLYDSKGSEFDDVLLYNFFRDSSVDLSQFRVLLNSLEENLSISAPRFDELRHAGVCSELKFLYVAITRARNNLWIVDSSVKAEPMKVIWKTLDLVEICTRGVDIAQLAVHSTPEDWGKSGWKFFEKNLYTQAWHCFKKAGLSREGDVAHAYHLRKLAEANPQSHPQHSEYFKAPAEKFIHCVSSSNTTNEEHAYLKAAGECFVHSGHDARAVEAFLDATEYTRAALHCEDIGKFHEALEIINMHKVQMERAVVIQIIHASKIYYLKKNQLDEAMKLFKGEDEALSFMAKYDLEAPRITLLCRMGKFADAAELHLVKGRYLEAIQLFIEDAGSSYSTCKARECIVHCLWRHMSFGTANSDKDAVRVLLDMYNQLHVEPGETEENDEITMFKAMVCQDSVSLLHLGQKLAENNIAVSLHSLDAALAETLVDPLQATEVAARLDFFLIYAKLLRDAVHSEDPYRSPHLQKLFNFSVTSDRMIIIPGGTLLHSKCKHSASINSQIGDNRYMLSIPEFQRLYREVLSFRLRTRVVKETSAFEGKWALLPSLRSSPHIKGDYATNINGAVNGVYHSHVRLHLQQVLVVDTLASFRSVQGPEVRKLHLNWITRLYWVLHSPHTSGHIVKLCMSGIPEAQKGFQVLVQWLHDIFRTLDPSHELFVSTASIVAKLSLDVTPHCLLSLGINSHYKGRTPFSSLRGMLKEGESWIIIRDLLDFLENDEYSIVGGIHVIEKILQEKHIFNLDVLCDFADHVCASTVVHSLLAENSTLKDIMLPRNPLITVLEQFNSTRRDTTFTPRFKKCMMILLRRLYCKVYFDHLHYEGKSLPNCSEEIRDVFIARICRCLCFLEYNLSLLGPDENERLKEVLTSLASSQEKRSLLSNICSMYASVHGYVELAGLLGQPSPEQELDDIIQLRDFHCDSSDNSNPHGVRSVTYNSFQAEDTTRLLQKLKLSTQRPWLGTHHPLAGGIQTSRPQLSNSSDTKHIPTTSLDGSLAISEPNSVKADGKEADATVGVEDVVSDMRPSSTTMALRHEFYETEEKLTISVFDRGADPEQVTVKFEPRTLTYEHGTKSLSLQPLKGEIDTEKSDYTVGKVKVEIRLVKASLGRWGQLTGDSPQPVATFTPTPTVAATRQRKNWEGITSQILTGEKEKTSEEDPNVGGDGAVNSFFQKIFADSDEDTRRAMMKSYQESGGTTLSTNWNDVKKAPVEVKPPSGTFLSLSSLTRFALLLVLAAKSRMAHFAVLEALNRTWIQYMRLSRGEVTQLWKMALGAGPVLRKIEIKIEGGSTARA